MTTITVMVNVIGVMTTIARSTRHKHGNGALRPLKQNFVPLAAWANMRPGTSDAISFVLYVTAAEN